MKAKRVLCPIDFSSTSEMALEFAATFCRANGGKLFIVYVESNPTPYGPGLYGSLPSPIHRDHERLWETKPADSGKIEFEHFLLFGDPIKEICKFIKHSKIDLVVIGTHGRRGVSRMIMGSVAEGLVRSSPVPVLTVKRPMAEEEVEETVVDKNAG